MYSVLSFPSRNGISKRSSLSTDTQGAPQLHAPRSGLKTSQSVCGKPPDCNRVSRARSPGGKDSLSSNDDDRQRRWSPLRITQAKRSRNGSASLPNSPQRQRLMSHSSSRFPLRSFDELTADDVPTSLPGHARPRLPASPRLRQEREKWADKPATYKNSNYTLIDGELHDVELETVL